jgi:CheY-like chemotaxis protein
VCRGTYETEATMATERGRLLLLLASDEPQSATALASAAHEDPGETRRRLQQLVTQGLIVADTGAAIAVYRLVRSPVPLSVPVAPPRILVVDDEAVMRDLVVEILDEEAYAAVALESPTTVRLLLEHLEFGLVLTDSFGRVPGGALVETAEVVKAAGATPVVLFTAHRVDLDTARAEGFRTVLNKPFELETFIALVRELLPV